MVEFHGDTPFPVEYKVGRRKPDRHADLQVCAQAMCLEEMLGTHVPAGAVYHVASRQRREVIFTSALRERVRRTIAAIRAVDAQTSLPSPVADNRCPPCSLVEACMPKVGAERKRLQRHYANIFRPEELDAKADPW